jgi:anti-sigma regulatory factor (Ser/Thr protein kinase)
MSATATSGAVPAVRPGRARGLAWPPGRWKPCSAVSRAARRRTGAVPATVFAPGHPAIEPGSGAAPATRSPGMIPVAWPLQSYLELGAQVGAVPCARLHTKQVLWEWQLEELAATAELVVSELVTNGVRAAQGLTQSRWGGKSVPGAPPIRLWLCSDRRYVVIQVWDGDHRMPIRGPADDLEAEGGRGLLLVETLCHDKGTYVPEGASGKIVWASLNSESQS